MIKCLRRRIDMFCSKNRSANLESFRDMVLILANTGLRPDEIRRLEYHDIEIQEDPASGQVILVITVRGKRGVGYCKSMLGAVHLFERLVERNNPESTDLIFPNNHAGLFKRVLQPLDLYMDREGKRRTLYSCATHISHSG